MEIDIAAVSLEFHGSQVEFRQAMKSLERFRFRYGGRKKFLFLARGKTLSRGDSEGGDDSIRRRIFGSSFESSATIGSVSLVSRKKVKAGIYKPCSFVIADQLGSICMMYRR